jgi:TP901 family phage tail tape measure protein
MADLAQLGIVINVSDQNAAQKLSALSTAADNAATSVDKLEDSSKRASEAVGKVGGKKATDSLKQTQTATEKAHKSYLDFLGDVNKLNAAFGEIGKTQTGLKELQKNLNTVGVAAKKAYDDGALVKEGFNDIGVASDKLALRIKEQKVALEALNSKYYDAQKTAAKDAELKRKQIEMLNMHKQALIENAAFDKERNAQYKREQKNIEALNKFKEKQIQLQKELAAEYSYHDREAKKYNSQLKIQKEELSRLEEAFNKIITRVKQFAAFIVAAAAVQAFTQAIRTTIGVIVDFDQALTSLQAIAGATATEASVMGETIKQIAADTKFSAQEVADGMQTIGKAGFSAGEALKMIQDVSNLATGALEDFNKVSSLIVTAIRSFGLEVVQTTEITDVFANAVTGSKLSTESLVTAFGYVGAAGAQAGLTLNEVSGTLMVLADNGIRASTMGTALRKTLLSMIAPNESLKNELYSVGLSLDDINPGMVGYEEALKNITPLVWDFEQGTVDMGKAQEFFGIRASQVAAILVKETAQGGGISKAIKSTEEFGAALRMAEKQQEGLGVKFKNLADSAKNVALAVGDAGLTSVLHTLVDALKAVVSGTEAAINKFPIAQFVGYAAAAAGVSAAIYGISSALKALVTSSAAKLLMGGFLTTPFGQITIAVTAAASILAYLTNQIQDTADKYEKLSVKINEQIDTLESWGQVLKKASEEGMAEYRSQMVKFISSNKELSEEILKSINERRAAGEELYTSFEHLLFSAGNVEEAYKKIDEAMKLAQADRISNDIDTIANSAKLQVEELEALENRLSVLQNQIKEIDWISGSAMIDRLTEQIEKKKESLSDYGLEMAQLVLDETELRNQTKEWGIALIKGMEESLGSDGLASALKQFGILWELNMEEAGAKGITALEKYLGELPAAIKAMESEVPLLKIVDYEKQKKELDKNLNAMRADLVKSDLFKEMGVSAEELKEIFQKLRSEGIVEIIEGLDEVEESAKYAKTPLEKLKKEISELSNEFSTAKFSSPKLAEPLQKFLIVLNDAGGTFGELANEILSTANATDGFNLTLEDLGIAVEGDIGTVYNLITAMDAFEKKTEVYEYALEVQKEIRSEEEKFVAEIEKLKLAMDIVGLSVGDAAKKIELLAEGMEDSNISAEALEELLIQTGIAANFTEEEIDSLIKKIEELFEKSRETKVDNALEDFFSDIDKEQEDLIKKQEKAQEELAKAQKKAYEDMYDTVYDFTRDVIDDWDDMGDTLVDMAEDMVKDIAAAFLTQTITMPIYMTAMDSMGLSTGYGGSVQGMSGYTEGAGVMSNVSGIFSAITGSTSETVANVLSSDIISGIGTSVFGAETWGTYGAVEAGTGAISNSGIVGGLSTAAPWAIGGSLAYSMFGDAVGLPTSEYSGFSAGTGAAIGTAIAGPIGTAVGTVLGGVVGGLFGGDDDYDESSLAYGFGMSEDSDPYTQLTSDKAVATEMGYGSFIDFSAGDSGIDSVSLETAFGEYFGTIFSSLDETVNGTLESILRSNPLSNYLDGWNLDRRLIAGDRWADEIDHYFETEGGVEELFSDLTDKFFEHYTSGMMDAMGLDTEKFNFDFLESIRGDGENLADTFINFAAIVGSVDDFMGQITNQMDNFGMSVTDAFNNILIIVSVLEEIDAGIEGIVTVSSITTINTLTDSWYELIESMEAANATTAQISEAESGMAKILGANITGLTADALQQAFSSGGDVNSILDSSIQSAAYAEIAQTIAEKYITGINEEIGNVWIESDGDISAVVEAMQELDTSEVQDEIYELQEAFGVLADSANDAQSTAEAMRIVTLAIEGQLTTAQKFEEWQIDNIEAMNLFSEIVADSVTASELEDAVDAFSELGLEGDDLNNVIQDLADSFVSASEDLSTALNDIESSMSDIPSTENLNKTDEDKFTELFDSFLNLPSLSNVIDPGYEYTDVEKEIDKILSFNEDLYVENKQDVWASNHPGETAKSLEEFEQAMIDAYGSLEEHFINAGYAEGVSPFSGITADDLANVEWIEWTIDGSDIEFTVPEITVEQEKVPGSGKTLESTESEISEALSALGEFSGTTNYQGFFDTLDTIASDVLYDIFGSDAASEISDLSDAYLDYISSDTGSSSSGGSSTSYDDTEDQINAILDQIQYDLDTINLSDFEKEIFDIEKSVDDYIASLEDLGAAEEDLALAREWGTAMAESAEQAEIERLRDEYLDYLQEEIDIRQTSYDEAKSVLEEYISDEEALIEARRNASESINDFIADLQGSDASPVQSMEYFEGRYAQLLSEAQTADAEDIESAISNLTGFTSEYLDFAGAYGGNDYNSLFNSVVGDLEALGVDQIDAADAQEAELQEIRDLIESTDDTLFDINQAVQDFVDAQSELDESAWMTEELDMLGSIDQNIDLLYQAAKGYYNMKGEELPDYVKPPTSGTALLTDITNDAGIDLNGLLFDILSAKLQQMIGNDTYSNLAASAAIMRFSNQFRDSFNLNELLDIVGTASDEYSFSGGGIISGPGSGYQIPTATFHGTEAIIPMENGSIKVDIPNQPAPNVQVKVFIDGKELKDNHVTWHRTDDEVHAAVRREAS